MPWGRFWRLGLRPWCAFCCRCIAPVLRVGVKWNSLFFIAAMGLLTVFWDSSPYCWPGQIRGLTALVRDGIPASSR